MGIIKITQDAVNRTLPLEAGWHLFKIEKYSEDDSKDKKSKNMVFDLVVIEPGSMNGRYGFARFNTKAIGMLIASGFLPAALDQPITEMIEFDPESLYGKEIYGLTKDEVYEGKIQKRTEQFAPSSKPPF